MFVVHTIKDGQANTTRDFGHVNQFFRENPLYRNYKEEPIFKECVEQGFIYISEYMVKMFSSGNNAMITYHKSLNLLLEEVSYNRRKYDGRR